MSVFIWLSVVFLENVTSRKSHYLYAKYKSLDNGLIVHIGYNVKY